VLACGAELKEHVLSAWPGAPRLRLAAHRGDLENAETLRSFTEASSTSAGCSTSDPEVVAHDLHPEYLSTKYALELDLPAKASSITTRTSPPALATYGVQARKKPGHRGGSTDRLRHRRPRSGR